MMQSFYDFSDQTLGELVGQLSSFLRSIIAEEVKDALGKMKNEPERLYTRDEACKLLSISKPTLWAWEKEGKLIPTRAGRRVLYRASDVQTLLSTR